MEHLTAFLTRMPKVELHVHLESTMPGEMLARFAARQGRDGPFVRECGYTPCPARRSGCTTALLRT